MSPWMAWQLIPRITISREVLDISWVYQREPVEITVQSDQENRPDIAQYRLDVERNEKADIMVRLAHVQHPVSLIQHHRFHPVQADGAPLHMVHQPPGGGHNNLGLFFQRRTGPTSPSTGWMWSAMRKRILWSGCWKWGIMSG